MDTNDANVGKVHGDGSFQPGSVRIVDYDVTNNNVLVRGSAAFGAAGFTMQELITAIKKDCNYPGVSSAGIKIETDNPLVIDFCLIGFGVGSKDSGIVSDELSWFTTKSAPKLDGAKGPYPNYIQADQSGSNYDRAHNTVNPGVMIFWPVLALGGGTAPTVPGAPWPCAMKPSLKSSIENGTTDFNFAGLIPAIRNALTNQISYLPHSPDKFPSGITAIKNAIIYVHCDSGVNRTGAAVLGYLMKYGTDLAQMKLSRNTGPPYSLIKAQKAANLAPPSNDSKPPGGSDILVAEAYCNFELTHKYDANLRVECVPLSGT